MTSQGHPQESLIQNWAAKGAICAGAVGAIVGLIVGLFAYAPTAWAAMFEVRMPAFVLGALLGAISGAVATALRRVRTTPSRPSPPERNQAVRARRATRPRPKPGPVSP